VRKIWCLVSERRSALGAVLGAGVAVAVAVESGVLRDTTDDAPVIPDRPDGLWLQGDLGD